MDKEVTQKVFLIPDDMQKEVSVIHLKHPRTSTTVLCTLDSENNLYEIIHFTNELSSWFIADSVTEDGSLFMVTMADPLFFIIPYACENEKFCRLEDFLTDENYPDCHKLLNCCTSEELLNIFDSKESAGFEVLCYNKSKVLHWLQQKAKYLACELQKKGIDISDGSRAASFQMRPEEGDEDKYLEYSCHLLSEYLMDELSNDLFSSLGIQKTSEKTKQNISDLEGKAKKRNTANISPTDDYSKEYSMNSAQDKQKTKLSAAQKKLLKVDKKGMKNISSFFQKK